MVEAEDIIGPEADRPPGGERRETLFVGDVHGCAAELEELLHRVGYSPSSHRLLLTGDAFSRGPDPVRVWEILRDTGAEMVLGNHDDRLMRQMRAHRGGGAVRFGRPDHRRTFAALRPVLDELLPWLERTPLSIEGEGFLLVHAGIHPERGPVGTSREEFLAIRTWPPTGGIDGPRWHDAIEPLPGRVVVFGHDASGGLVVKRREEGGRPWAVGLDSGCVYGGKLSAWVLERDELIQVDSRQDGESWRSG